MKAVRSSLLSPYYRVFRKSLLPSLSIQRPIRRLPHHFTFSREEIIRSMSVPNSFRDPRHWVSYPPSEVRLISSAELILRVRKNSRFFRRWITYLS